MLCARDADAESPMPFAMGYQPTPSSLAQGSRATTLADRSGRPAPNREAAEAPEANVASRHLENAELFQQIVEALRHVVALSDASGAQVFFVNAAYERIWRQPRETLYEDSMAFLEAVHPEDRERVRDAVFGEPGREFDVEFRVVRPDGDQRWVWSRGVPVRDANGRIYRVASITEDITERKAVAESHERLLRGFTHDVKNPLGAADGYLSLMELGVLGETSAAQLEAVKRARRTIRTALTLVSQLLEIERAKAGELIIERERVDLGALMRDCVEDVRSAARVKHQDVTLQVPPGENVLVVESDRARVRQILANLLSNAVKYTQPDGRITVSARVADGDEGPGRGDWFALSVADNGPGIPREKHRMLFREFSRFDPAAAEGSGVGLAISQYIAHALDAAITYASAPGAGSTFTLWLPRDRAQRLRIGDDIMRVHGDER